MARGLLDLAARLVDAGTPTSERTNPTDCVLEELGDDIALVPSFSHVVAVRTAEGLVLFDTSLAMAAERARAALRGWSDDPVHSIVYTHGHLDHVGGARTFVEEAAAHNRPRPQVVAHEAVPERFDRYELTDGYNLTANARQFGTTRIALGGRDRFSLDWVRPDVTFREHLALDVGDLRIELQHGRGETDDHLWAWMPQHAAVAVGDFITWVFPNAGNPQKVQRYPREWALALREMATLQPELLLPAHGLPVAGRERIAHLLDEVATALELLVDGVLERMNAGEPLDRIVAEVRVPDHLAGRPYLQAVYDEPEFVIRNIWRAYGGWWDGNPARLKPAPDARVAREVTALAGGAAALIARADSLSSGDGATDEDLRAAAQLVEWARTAAPDDADVVDAYRAVYTRRRDAERSLMARGVFATAVAALDESATEP